MRIPADDTRHKECHAPDQPTAALDPDAEERLFERFRALTHGKTALLISHRFSTVRMADQILVIEGGCIIEAGTHAELISRPGLYRTLWQRETEPPVTPGRGPRPRATRLP